MGDLRGVWPSSGWWEANSGCSRNLKSSASGSNQNGVHMLVLSLKLPSSTWVGDLAPGEELRDVYEMVLHTPCRGTWTVATAALLLLDFLLLLCSHTLISH